MADVKIIVMGKGGVGKSCLTQQFVNGMFVGASYNATIEDKFTKNLEVDGQNVFAEILDTAGQDQYSALRKFFMPLGDVFVLVYDITQDFTFEEINPIKDEIFAANDRHMELPFILIGNKSDMEEDRVVTVEEGQNLCKAMEKSGGHWHFMEASAKENVNVTELFRKAISEALRLQTNNNAGSSGSSGVMGAGTQTHIGRTANKKKKKKSMCTLL
jgi:small GTP-binding protein